MSDKIAEIRERHEAGERASAVADREWLLAEVERLRGAARDALEALTSCNSRYGHRCVRCDSEVDEGGHVVVALRKALEDGR